jgi:hypothetical protein
MRIALCLLIALFCISCGKRSAVSKKLSDCDSLAITFNAPNTDSVISIHTVADKKAIRKLSGFLSGKSDEFHKCGYDGNMIFYKNGQQVMPVVFKFAEEGCRHFLYTLDEKLTSIRMSNEATNFLKSLAEGKEWY